MCLVTSKCVPKSHGFVFTLSCISNSFILKLYCVSFSCPACSNFFFEFALPFLIFLSPLLIFLSAFVLLFQIAVL